MNCGIILRNIRRAKGLKLAEVASQLGRTDGWLQNIEAGRRPLKVKDLDALCHIYDVRPDKIIRMAEQESARTTNAG